MSMYEEKVNEIKTSTTVAKIKEFLDSGYTWFKKNDLGNGSVQEQFSATDLQVVAIRKHPMLKDLETTTRVFVIIDDTKDGSTIHTQEPVSKRTDNQSQQPVVPVGSGSTKVDTVSENDDSFSAFANL